MFRLMNHHVDVLPPVPRWRPAAATMVCLVAGVMLTTAMPPFRGTALLAPIAIAILFHQLRGADRPTWLAFVFGIGHAGTLMSWLFFLDPAKSIPTRALVPIQAVAAIVFVAAHFALLGFAVGRLRRRSSSRRALGLMPVLWIALELLRSSGELGFPWCLSGAAWLDTPLASLYATAGEIGVGAATVLSSAALVAVVDMLRTRADRGGLGRGLLVVSAVAWFLLWLGHAPLSGEVPARQHGDGLHVACVQADVSQADKWQEAKIDSTRIPYAGLTAAAAAAGAEFTVWAETAIPAYVRFDREHISWVRDVARRNHMPLLVGFPDAQILEAGSTEEKRTVLKYNAAGLFSREGTLIDTYRKHQLVPFGEAIPFQRWLPVLGRIDVGQAEWSQGALPQPLALNTDRGLVPIACLVCYEAAFSNLARHAVREGATVLVNITNDGWFGYSAGPRQHAALARIRAIECGVPLVRCANNGISMICGPDGEVRASLGLRRRGLITASIETVARGTRYVRFGWWPLLVFLGPWTVVATVLTRSRGRERAET